jgi:hypothetical protein
MRVADLLRAWRDGRAEARRRPRSISRKFTFEPLEPRLLLSVDPLLLPPVAPTLDPPPVVAQLEIPAPTIQWDAGGDGTSWHDAQNWTDDRLPGPADDVLIDGAASVIHSQGVSAVHTLDARSPLTLSGGSLSVEAGAEAAALTMTGGRLDGPGDLLLTGPATWTGGRMADGGTTRVAPGVTLALSGDADKELVGRTLENFGGVTWDRGTLRTGGGALIDNRWLWEIRDDQTISDDLGGLLSAFINTGTVWKSAGVGATLLDILLTNAGLVRGDTGAIELRADTTSQGGAFAAAAGASVLFPAAADYAFNDGTTFFGPGLIRLSAGTAVLEGVIRSENFEFAGGDLSGTATIDGAFSWTGGRLVGASLTLPEQSSLSILGGADKDLVGATLTNAGTVWWNAGRLRTGQGTLIVNSGLWDVQTDQVIANDEGGAQSSFLNIALHQNL